MTIQVFQGERASHTHENRMLDAFIEAIRPRWEKSADSLILVSNAFWNQAEIDLVCILETAIVVVDFKAYRGKISVTENGPWLNGSLRIAGGSRPNPLIQIKHNKFAVMHWLKQAGLLGHCNLGHISGVAVFNGPIEVEGHLPANVSQWFSIIALEESARHLDRLASPQISISMQDQTRIVETLNLSEYRWTSHQVVDVGAKDRSGGQLRTPTDSQEEALRATKRFLSNSSENVFCISGMTATGKSSLIPMFTNPENCERPVVVLAPNNRFARNLRNQFGIEASGVYHHIYNTSSKPDREKSDRGEIEVIPLRGDAGDQPDCVYVIDDAHLVTDNYFEPEPGKRFGTGRLVSDLFQHMRLSETDRKAIILSDPFHVTQAKEADCLPSQELWERKGLSGEAFSMTQLIRDDASGAILDNALQLARGIDNQSFAELDFYEGNGLALATGSVAADEAEQQLRSSPSDILLIAHSNADVATLNDWARKKRFDGQSERRIVPDDWLEVYSFIRNDDPLQDTGPELDPGDLIHVDSVGEIETITQPLSGRDVPVEFRTQEVRVKGASTGFPILLDFLLAESKEIDPEIQIAIQVWSKATGKREPVKARFSYAATAHHARSMRRLRTVVSPPKSMGRHNESYFRWLYTAITRATSRSTIANWEPLHVFDEATLNRTGSTLKASIPIGGGYRFDPERDPTADEQQLSVPVGLDSNTKGLREAIAIWLALQPVIETSGMQVLRASSHPYLVNLELGGSEHDNCDLKVSYKADYTISSVRSDNHKIWFDIAAGLANRVSLQPDQARIVARLGKLDGLEDQRILSVFPTDYRLRVVLGSQADGLADLEINHDKDGRVSSVRVLHFSDEKILDNLSSAFGEKGSP